MRIHGIIDAYLYAVAVSAHIVTNDFSLSFHHKHLYRKIGRWIMIAALLTGWLISFLTSPAEDILRYFRAFLVGSTIVNTLKEELPESRGSKAWAFILGALAYSGLILMLEGFRAYQY